jgi:hypothetical protein
MIRLAAIAEIDAIWPRIAAGMEECCRRSGGDITPDWLFFTCRKGDALLAVIEDGEGEFQAALIAAPQAWGGRRVLRILALSGRDMAGWLEELTAFELPLGIDTVIFEGRAGWGRIPGVREIRRVYEADMKGARPAHSVER